MLSEIENPQKGPIFYWRGVLTLKVNLDKEIPGLKPLISKLLQGEYQAAHIKKLKGYRIYSARLNKANRLVFTTIERNNLSHLLLLWVGGHYKHCEFLKNPQILTQFLEKNGEALTRAIEEGDFLTPETFSLPELGYTGKESLTEEDFKPADFFKQKFIFFNNAQNQALVSTLPLLLSGSAGSGKSSVALSLLSENAVNWDDQESELRFLYVSHSAKLVKDIKAMWNQLPHVKALSPEAVQFMTYRALLHTLPGLQEAKFMDNQDFFDQWLPEYLLKNDTKRKLDTLPLWKEALDKKDLIYQEFRLISGEPDYLSLGRKQSLFSDKKEKQWIFTAYHSFLTFLKEKEEIHPAFYPLEVKPIYDLIVVDEAQDLSRLQEINLTKLAKNLQIVFLVDTHQSLEDSKSIRPFLYALALNSQRILNHIPLPCSYRCSLRVSELANRILAQKRILTGGLADKEEYPEIVCSENTAPGRVKWLLDKKALAKELPSLLDETASGRFAVIAPPGYEQEVKKIMPKAKVFTSKESKGLEFDRIFIYRLFDLTLEQNNTNIKIFEMAAKKLQQSNNQDHTHRANKNKGDFKEEFARFYNWLYTAVTRAVDSVIIYQENRHELRPVLDFLIEDRLNHEELPYQPLQPSTKEEWERRFQEFIDNDNKEQAKSIFLNHLGGTEEQFQVIIQEQKQPLSSKESLLLTTEIPSHISEQPPSSMVKNTRNQRRRRNKAKNQLTSLPKTNPKDEIKAFLNPIEFKKKIQQLNNYTPEMLIELFFQTNTHTERGCLFSEIFLNNALFNIFNIGIQKNILAFNKKITLDLLCTPPQKNKLTPFYYAVQIERGRKFLLDLIGDNLDFTEALLLAALTQVNYKNNDSLFFYLTEDRPGYIFLNKLLQKAPNIIQHIKKVLHLKTISGRHSPFSRLIRTEDYHLIFILWLMQNPSLVHLTSIEEISALIPNTQLIFSGLITSFQGAAIAYLLLKTNPSLNLVEKIGLNFPLLFNSASRCHNLYFLSVFHPGDDILSIFMHHNPDLIKEINGTLLCEINPDHKQSTLLSFLIGKKTRKIFKALLTARPTLVNEIPPEVVCRIPPKTHFSILHALAQQLAAGSKDIEFILEKLMGVPNFIKEITPDALYYIREEDGFSPIYCFSTNEIGCNILLKLFKENPDLAKQFSLMALTYIYPNNDTSVLNLLSFRLTGLKILEIFFTSTTLAQDLPAKTICHKPDEESLSLIQQLLYYFGRSGQALLVLLQTKNPALFESPEVISLSEEDVYVKMFLEETKSPSGLRLV